MVPPVLRAWAIKSCVVFTGTASLAIRNIGKVPNWITGTRSRSGS
jgi:hypothetical protein